MHQGRGWDGVGRTSVVLPSPKQLQIILVTKSIVGLNLEKNNQNNIYVVHIIIFI